ncbi:MAG: hypothetical protein J2P47_13105 [Acetobacteraceae bacterium]|nr:hypothetical protein [Acetobacteraceae bacterium]
MGGCGFEPVYARHSSGAPGVAATELSAVSVDLIPDRPGQLLRQALQQRLEGSGSNAVRRYALSVDYGISGEGIGVRQDTAVTRIRFTGHAGWTLRANDASQTVMAHDTVRAVDGINILNEQYFAADLETETVQRRMAETLADQIVLQLAVFFRRRASQTAASS